VADGAAVDWSEIERRFAHSQESSAALNLRLLQDLDAERGPLTASPFKTGNLGYASKLLLGLAGLQVLLALVAFVLGPGDSKAISGALVISAMLVFTVSALVLLTAGSRDPRSLPLAGVFLCVSAATSQRFLAQLPLITPWIPAQFLGAFLPEAFLPFFFWSFVRDFPRVVRFSRWSRVIEPMRWLSLCIGLVFFAVNAYARLHGAGAEGDLLLLQPFLRRSTGIYWGTLAILTLLAPLVSLLRQRQAPGDEKKRVQAFLSGLAVGIVPLFAQILLETLIPAYNRLTDVPRWQALSGTILYAFLLSIPVTTGYSVVARRVLDVRLALSLAARFALARGSLSTLAVAPLLLLASQAYRHRDLPLAVVLSRSESRVWFMISLCGVALLLLREPLLRSAERRLLGRAIAASSALASFGQEAQRAGSLPLLVQLAKRDISGFLRCDVVTLLLREPEGVVRDVEGWVRPLQTDTSLFKMEEASPESMLVDRTARGSLFTWLPEDERRWIESADLCLLLPVAATDDSLLGLLAVGRARTGAQYSLDELRGLEAFGSSLSLALEHLPEGGRSSSPAGIEAEGSDFPAGECAQCGSVQDSPSGSCRCGGALTPAVVPRLLHGKFRTERVLGRGGMGVIYRANDLALGRTVALKTLPRLEIDALKRLQREARSMASVVHPGLATIFGIETWRGVPVLVVEYLAGGTLAERLTGPMEPRAVIELGIEIATALEAMHRRGLLHRDLKPSNIGFSEEGKVKLLDFGLARLFDEAGAQPRQSVPAELMREGDAAQRLTLSRHIAGTPLYLSPEALAGAPASPAQDLWALFIVLWEALAGQHPLQNRPLPEAIRSLARAEIPDVRASLVGAPETLANLLDTALHHLPQKRPADAGTARRALEVVLAI